MPRRTGKCNVFETEGRQWNIIGKLQGDRLAQFVQVAELVEGKFNLDSKVPETRKWPFEDPGEIGEVIRGSSEFQCMELGILKNLSTLPTA